VTRTKTSAPNSKTGALDVTTHVTAAAFDTSSTASAASSSSATWSGVRGVCTS
jgi:hypothetical protein